tara:strand:- start:183 stop:653 length:471 start_codon:yes stop_codon:yes gene_type:complete
MLKNLYKILLIFIINLLPKIRFLDKPRGYIYILLGVNAGKNFKVASNVFIYSPQLLKAGNNCYIGVSSYLGNGEIALGNNVLIGNNVSILPSNHKFENATGYRFSKPEFKKISIDDNVWVCSNCIIVAGVKISKDSKISAGTTVIKDNSDNKFLKR